MTRYTIDELSSATGLPSSTIRLYRQRGLLQPPEREGRHAYYDERQLRELDLIDRLKERGYSLASIADVLDLWRGGTALESILEDDSGDDVGALQLDELFTVLFPDGEVDAGLIARVAELGLLDLSEGIQIVAGWGLEVGVALMRMGVPPRVVLDEYEALQTATDEIAGRFADLFETHVLPGEDDPSARLGELLRLAREVVSRTLLRSLRREGERRLSSR